MAEFNAFEVVLWSLLAVLLLVRAVGHPVARGHVTTASALLFAFAISDVVELRTGVWWRPWWLAVWKAACLAGLAVCFLHWRLRRQSKSV